MKEEGFFLFAFRFLFFFFFLLSSLFLEKRRGGKEGARRKRFGVLYSCGVVFSLLYS